MADIWTKYIAILLLILHPYFGGNLISVHKVYMKYKKLMQSEPLIINLIALSKSN